jgi:K+-transporting ATPase KdpF subunit
VKAQMFDIILGLVVATGIFGFLILALWRPGQF